MAQSCLKTPSTPPLGSEKELEARVGDNVFSDCLTNTSSFVVIRNQTGARFFSPVPDVTSHVPFSKVQFPPGQYNTETLVRGSDMDSQVDSVLKWTGITRVRCGIGTSLSEWPSQDGGRQA